jgi:hypothetical protein
MINELHDGCVQLRRRWTGDVGEFSLVDEAATDKLMQKAAQRIEKLEAALERIRDNEWVQLGGPPTWLSEIAEEALK